VRIADSIRAEKYRISRLMIAIFCFAIEPSFFVLDSHVLFQALLFFHEEALIS